MPVPTKYFSCSSRFSISSKWWSISPHRLWRRRFSLKAMAFSASRVSARCNSAHALTRSCHTSKGAPSTADHYRRPEGIKPRDSPVNGILECTGQRAAAVPPAPRASSSNSARPHCCVLVNSYQPTSFRDDKKRPAPPCRKDRLTQGVKRPHRTKTCIPRLCV